MNNHLSSAEIQVRRHEGQNRVLCYDFFMDKKVADFMIFTVEQVANRFFDSDQQTAYLAMRKSGLWEFFSDTYETSHTVGVEYLMQDAEEWLTRSGVINAGISR